MCGTEKQLAVSCQPSARVGVGQFAESAQLSSASRDSPLRASRRGVLLLVVLSMLVLFMLIGTAFLMSSSQSRDSAKANAKKDRLGNHATKLLDGALLKVVRDTENPDFGPPLPQPAARSVRHRRLSGGGLYVRRR